MTDILTPPEGLGQHARFAWDRMVRAGRTFSEADELALEAAARAWGRWKSLEERIAEAAGANIMAGEVAKGANGTLQISALRQAANDAWASYERLARDHHFLPPSTESPVRDGDLFGYPDRPGRGQKGRPAFQPTPRDRNRVRLLLALGWSNERIAAALEVSEPTLRKYFRVELKERLLMRDRLTARRFEIVMEQVAAGSIPAMRELDRMIETNDAMIAEAHAGRRDKAPEPERLEKLGKKEERERLAHDTEERLMQELDAEARGLVKH